MMEQTFLDKKSPFIFRVDWLRYTGQLTYGSYIY